MLDVLAGRHDKRRECRYVVGSAGGQAKLVESHAGEAISTDDLHKGKDADVQLSVPLDDSVTKKPLLLMKPHEQPAGYRVRLCIDKK